MMSETPGASTSEGPAPKRIENYEIAARLDRIADLLQAQNTERNDWRFTALFSNTARANELHATRDWVVLYSERRGEEGQGTVVTETHGSVAGRRVVRGRERECAIYYESSASAA